MNGLAIGMTDLIFSNREVLCETEVMTVSTDTTTTPATPSIPD